MAFRVVIGVGAAVLLVGCGSSTARRVDTVRRDGRLVVLRDTAGAVRGRVVVGGAGEVSYIQGGSGDATSAVSVEWHGVAPHGRAVLRPGTCTRVPPAHASVLRRSAFAGLYYSRRQLMRDRWAVEVYRRNGSDKVILCGWHPGTRDLPGADDRASFLGAGRAQRAPGRLVLALSDTSGESGRAEFTSIGGTTHIVVTFRLNGPFDDRALDVRPGRCSTLVAGREFLLDDLQSATSSEPASVEGTIDIPLRVLERRPFAVEVHDFTVGDGIAACGDTRS